MQNAGSRTLKPLAVTGLWAGGVVTLIAGAIALAEPNPFVGEPTGMFIAALVWLAIGVGVLGVGITAGIALLAVRAVLEGMQPPAPRDVKRRSVPQPWYADNEPPVH